MGLLNLFLPLKSLFSLTGDLNRSFIFSVYLTPAFTTMYPESPTLIPLIYLLSSLKKAAVKVHEPRTFVSLTAYSKTSTSQVSLTFLRPVQLLRIDT